MHLNFEKEDFMHNAIILFHLTIRKYIYFESYAISENNTLLFQELKSSVKKDKIRTTQFLIYFHLFGKSFE